MSVASHALPPSQIKMKETHTVLKRYSREWKTVELHQIALPERLGKPLRIATSTIIVEKKKPEFSAPYVRHENI